jgi:hypothetical protein
MGANGQRDRRRKAGDGVASRILDRHCPLPALRQPAIPPPRSNAVEHGYPANARLCSPEAMGAQEWANCQWGGVGGGCCKRCAGDRMSAPDEPSGVRAARPLMTICRPRGGFDTCNRQGGKMSEAKPPAVVTGGSNGFGRTFVRTPGGAGLRSDARRRGH